MYDALCRFIVFHFKKQEAEKQKLLNEADSRSSISSVKSIKDTAINFVPAAIETTKKALATTKVELKLPTALNLLSPVTFNSRPPSPSNFPCSPRTSVKWNNARRPSFVEMADAAASGASGVFQHFLTRKASKISIMETQA